MAILLAFGVTFAYPFIETFLLRQAPEAMGPLHRGQVHVCRVLITPAATLALVAGIYLASDRDYFSEVWVQIPFAILIVLLGLTGAFFIPTEKRLADAAEAGRRRPRPTRRCRGATRSSAPYPPGSCSWPCSSWSPSWAPDCGGPVRRPGGRSRAAGGRTMVAMADARRAQRTLVKSPPELWAEVSDVDALARHLGEFGEIRITRLEPETTVAWEGDRARGTVALEAAGWGTRVTLTAVAEADAEGATTPVHTRAADEAPTTEIDAIAAAPVHEGETAPESEGTTRRGWLGRLFRRRVAAPAAAAPVPEPPVAPEALEPVVEPEPTLDAPPAPPEPALAPAVALAAVAGPPPALSGADAEGILTAVLDDLGAAHHRPFSR